jgi:predicted metal-dependent phosphoesterase TrpH
VRVRIDLHSHSNVSDGTTSPSEVVERAVALGLDVLALTDHDTDAGWVEAAAAARRTGLSLVPGMEISTKHRDRGVHVLGYLLDPGFPPLASELGRILEGRDRRLDAMLERLAAAGVHLSAEEVRQQAGVHGVIGRPHFADAMVARHIVHDRAEAFDRWLRPGRPGFVARYAPATSDMIRLVAAAGGVAVIAHPWGRNTRQVPDLETFAQFAALGLVGMEVDHEDHSPENRERLRSIAVQLGLVVTGSSDYHGAGKVGHELGCNLTAPAEFDRLLDAAARNAAASGRQVRAVVGAAAGGART